MGNGSRWVIEFCGLPGAGKSTLWTALARARSYVSPAFLTLRESLSVPRPAVASGLLSRGAVRAGLHRTRPLGRLLYDAPRDPETQAALAAWGGSHDAFLRACMAGSPKDFPWPDYRLMGYRWLAEVVEAYALLENARALDRPVLLDEGIAQKVHSLIPLEPAADDRRAAYYACMPLIRGIVHLRVPVATVTDRLKARASRRLTLRHLRIDGERRVRDLEAMDVAFAAGVGILAERGVAVLEVEGTRSVVENVAAIMDFLRGLGTCASPS